MQTETGKNRNRTELQSALSWINRNVRGTSFRESVLCIVVPDSTRTVFDPAFLFFSEKEQTPLQEALNQLIRQLQR